MNARLVACRLLAVAGSWLVLATGCGSSSGGAQSGDGGGAGGAAGPNGSGGGQGGSDGGGPDQGTAGDADDALAPAPPDDAADAPPVACVTAVECPGDDGECAHRTCIDGICGVGKDPAGKVLASQTAGDCLLRKCDGDGHAVTSADDSDLPDDLNPCTNDLCAGGVASHQAQPAGTLCGATTTCSAGGECTGCTQASDCPGSDGACRTRTCSQGTCGFSFKPAGTAVADPTPGDCRGLQCDGLGVEQVVDAPADTPSDDNPCTIDRCNGGTPTFAPVARGTVCGDGKICDGLTNCASCLTAATCPGTDDDCQARTCTAGVCGFAYSPAGRVLATQTAGDCQKAICDGQGGTTSVADDTDCPAGCTQASDCGTDTFCTMFACTNGHCQTMYLAAGTPTTVQTPHDCKRYQCDALGASTPVPDDSDLPVDGTLCTADLCANGTPSNPPVAAGTPCSDNGGTRCNGAGVCVQCATATDCGTDTECQKFTCSAQGLCGRNDPPAGTALASQTTGDCKKAVCDGLGGFTSVNDDTDGPNDGNPCTQDSCSNGSVTHPPSAAGVACSLNSGVQCDGAGACGPLVMLVKINEVESNGGVPGDWVELYNTSVTVAVDISGWVFKDSDDTHSYTIPTGTIIAPHGFLTLEEADFGFGLGAMDAARLFDASGMMLIDSYSWPVHAPITYGRCPDGTGPFAMTTAATKGAANACPP